MLVPPKLVLGFKPIASLKEKVKKWRAGIMAKNSVQEIAAVIAGKHRLSQQDAEAFVSSIF